MQRRPSIRSKDNDILRPDRRTRRPTWLLATAAATALALGHIVAWASPPDARGATAQAPKTAETADPMALPLTDRAVASLRARGQAGVDSLRAAEPTPGSPEHNAWRQALDRVCTQRDCWASGLFWHTDFDRAVAEAERRHRPILSLRLLGHLDDELSCANSRFFRTVLYADPEVAQLLREGFVLHWSSERPVPRLTIDFGDGRRLDGTITGNSIHYVLDSHGRLVDALPGLYGPGLFRERLTDLGRLARRLTNRNDGAFLDSRAEHHRRQRLALGIAVERFGMLPPTFASDESGDTPSARRAVIEAVSKSFVERPLVDSLSTGFSTAAAELEVWRQLAALRPGDWALSDASRRFLVHKHRAYLEDLAAATPGSPTDPVTLQRTLDAFEQSVAVDTMRNEYQLHATIHGWLADDVDPKPGIERFNRRVYADLFLTPATDPWLGLVSPEVYAALVPSGGPRR